MGERLPLPKVLYTNFGQLIPAPTICETIGPSLLMRVWFASWADREERVLRRDSATRQLARIAVQWLAITPVLDRLAVLRSKRETRERLRGSEKSRQPRSPLPLGGLPGAIV